MKKIIFMIFFSLFFYTNFSWATQYFVATTGSNSNPGTSILPFQTISFCSTVAVAGDICNIASGTYREQLTIPKSGSIGSPITYSGAGPSTIIDGALLASGWTNTSGNIYSSNIGSITAPTQLYVDGNFMDVAHYPATWAWIPATSNGTNTTLIDSKISSGGATPLTSLQVVGSTVIVKTQSFNISQSVATGFNTSTGTITVTSPVFGFSTQSGWGYYLQNMLWMMTYPGSWFYDGSNTLSLWTLTNDSPSLHIVEIPTNQYGIYDNANNYITIQNMTVEYANLENIHISNSSNVIVNNVNIVGGINGGNFTNVTTGFIQNSSFQNVLQNGISENSSSGVTISGNTLNNLGNVGNPKPAGDGIGAYGNTSSTINKNTITNTGYDGIIYAGNNMNVTNNIINNTCLVLDDCGGIYTNTKGTQINIWKSTISGNTVTNSIGNESGTTNGASETAAQGIYLDDLSNGYTVTNNYVNNADYAIYIHTGYNNIVTGNTIFQARNYALFIAEDSALCGGGSSNCVGVVKNNTVTGNIFESLSNGNTQFYGTGVADYFSDFGSPVSGFGNFNNNKYCHPNTTSVIGTQNILTVTNYTLSQWQTATNQDLNSTDVNALCESSGGVGVGDFFGNLNFGNINLS